MLGPCLYAVSSEHGVWLVSHAANLFIFCESHLLVMIRQQESLAAAAESQPSFSVTQKMRGEGSSGAGLSFCLNKYFTTAICA